MLVPTVGLLEIALQQAFQGLAVTGLVLDYNLKMLKNEAFI